MRAGQYWESPGALMEIVSFDQDIGVGERRWNGLGNKLMVGNRLTLNKEDIRSGGTDYYINLNELRAMSTRLATVVNAPERLNDRVVQIESLIKRSLMLPTAKEAPYSGEWGRVDCFDFDTIYTALLSCCG